jgi:molecular chaperone DnaJ
LGQTNRQVTTEQIRRIITVVQTRGQPGSDLIAVLQIELLDAATGASRTIDVIRQEICTDCGSSGWRTGSTPPPCIECGRGAPSTWLRRLFPIRASCSTCGGNGPAITDPCDSCQGAGRIPRACSFQIQIPPGVESGMWLQLRNQGHAGDNGLPRGNLKIRIIVKEHPIFERRNKDLHCQVEVDPAAMLVGTDVQVATLEGLWSLRIPQGTQSGDQFRMPGLGMPDLGGGRRGDVVVRVLAADWPDSG